MGTTIYEDNWQIAVRVENGKRFAMLNNKGLNRCLMNGHYDSENPGQVITKGEYWEIYDNQSEIGNRNADAGNPIEITGNYAEKL